MVDSAVGEPQQEIHMIFVPLLVAGIVAVGAYFAAVRTMGPLPTTSRIIAGLLVACGILALGLFVAIVVSFAVCGMCGGPPF